MPCENRNRTSVSLEDRIKAVTMCQQGKSFAAIGRELNRSKSYIKRTIDKLGLVALAANWPINFLSINGQLVEKKKNKKKLLS
ncbi:unnamed protein product, partial [Brachionus calyciflorus]